MDLKDMPIGFFDSGVGGISILKEAVKLMPEENYIYYGDSKNAPYGSKNSDEIKELVFNVADFLTEKGIKAMVVACNTATSVAIEELRKKYPNMPIIGVEPALKPAIEYNKKGKIVIMATPVTLSEKKFSNLMEHFDQDSNIEPLPCPQLVEFVENGIFDGEELTAYLQGQFSKFKKEEIGTVVLGCTHFPFVSKVLSKILNEDTHIIDGSIGTAKHLKNRLIEFNIKRDEGLKGEVHIYNSSEDEKLIELSKKLLNY